MQLLDWNAAQGYAQPDRVVNVALVVLFLTQQPLRGVVIAAETGEPLGSSNVTLVPRFG